MKPKIRYEVSVSNVTLTYRDKPTVVIPAVTFYFTHVGILMLSHRAGDEVTDHRANRVRHSKVHAGMMRQMEMGGHTPFKVCSYRIESVLPVSSVGRLT
jgi:hypothetical protein